MALLKANRFANDNYLFIPIGNEINRIFFIEITKRTKTISYIDTHCMDTDSVLN